MSDNGFFKNVYFAYGSNMNHEHMKRRCPETKFLGPAYLLNYQVAFLYPSTSFPGGGAADIIPKEGSVVWGALYKTTPDDLEKLDFYEDLSKGGYHRKVVDVVSENEKRKAVTYQVSQKLTQEMPPREDYLEIMLDGARQSGLPHEYINDLSEKYSFQDPIS